MTNRSTEDDAGFASAVERAYLRELEKILPGTIEAQLTLHSDLLERAIYRADRRSGGIRFKMLAHAVDLETRLLRALARKLNNKPDD